LSNFIKHCTRCNEIAIHKSKNPLYLIPNTNYVICKETKEIYEKIILSVFVNLIVKYLFLHLLKAIIKIIYLL